MVQTVFSVAATLERDAPDPRPPQLSFNRLPMLHFASVVGFDEPRGAPAKDFDRTLVLESCVDGPLEEYLDALVATSGAELIQLFEHCRGFRAENLRAFLDSHVIRPDLFHIGSPWLRVEHIRSGAALRNALVEEVQPYVSAGSLRDTPLQVVDRLRTALNVPASPKTHWHLDEDSVKKVLEGSHGAQYEWYADPVSRWPSRLREWAKSLLLGLGVLALVAAVFAAGFALWLNAGWPAAGAYALALYAIWRLFWSWLQRPRTVFTAAPGDETRLRTLLQQEDLGLHNHMSSLVLLKPGRLRRLSIRAVLWSFNRIYRTLYTDLTPGRLQGLPTIHFGHWSLVPLEDRHGGRHEGLLFLSNYDGSWHTYLDDFLEFLFRGVVLIWATATTFPSPLDGRTFKAWARTRMHTHLVWYDQRYPDLTVGNIHNNEQLRRGLLNPPKTEYGALLWLARLGAIKRGDEELESAPAPLPTHDMQGLLLRGYGRLPDAVYLLLRFDGTDDGGEGARRWLQSILGAITDGRELDPADMRRETSALNVAFTRRGLETLGLPADALGQFPRAFREGIAPEPEGGVEAHRSRILGDVGDSRPDDWQWGGRDGERAVDALLAIYADTPVRCDTIRRHCQASFVRLTGGTVVAIVTSEGSGNGGPAVEHFGFRDGLSQPKIRDTWQVRRGSGDAPDQMVEPGEFILGYEAEDGSVTPGIVIPASLDPGGELPPAPDHRDRDFGRNGTFLVARQLAQDVAEFRRFTADAAGVGAARHGVPAAEAVAARLMGRWRGGAPLVAVTHPGDPNDFSFSADLHGFACPIGSHVRRANPRDSLSQDTRAALAAVQRHRLLRRGRRYGPPLPPDTQAGGHEGRGMMFICLNADIERQFEFVQQNWINSPTFGGLYAERDPIVGAPPPTGFTVQRTPVSVPMRTIPRFVTVKGGEYFFLPGMSALRYLARLDPAALPQAPSLATPSVPAAVEPSAAQAAFARVSAALAWLKVAWAVRFPLLLMTGLAVLPIAAAGIDNFSLPLFVTGAFGVFLVAWLASIGAWVSMVTLRLVLMYGTRVGLSRPRWTGPATWKQVFAFQVLALPAIAVTVESTLDAQALAPPGRLWLILYAASAAGLALGLVTLGLATAIQSIRPGSRPDLFAPRFPVLWSIARGIARRGPLRRLAWRISSVSDRIVHAVPVDVGRGYINYRTGRFLPGHAFAAVLAALVLILYAAGFFLLDPARSAAGASVPPLAYVIFVLIAAGWVLSASAFFFDRYRLPTLVMIAAWLIVVGTVTRADRVFEVGGPGEPAAGPAAVATAAATTRPGPAIVVAAEGYGLASSAWLAEVLTALAAGDHGRRFADGVRLISATSGAALATTHFVNAYSPDGFALEEAALEQIRERSRSSASSEAWWGLLYPDLVRTLAPFLAPAAADRGWAMEQAWRRDFPDRRGPLLSAWRRDVASGWRPATVFGVTGVETGDHGLLATYRARARGPDGPDAVTLGRDIPVVTAARLSAAFPYVAPQPRPATADRRAYHVADGGYSDNSSLVAALEWIEDAGTALESPVMLIEVRSGPRTRRADPQNPPLLLEAIGPLQALIAVRYGGQLVRHADMLRYFLRGRPIEHAVFDLNDPTVPLTWSLSPGELHSIANALRRGDNAAQLRRVREFLDSN